MKSGNIAPGNVCDPDAPQLLQNHSVQHRLIFADGLWALVHVGVTLQILRRKLVQGSKPSLRLGCLALLCFPERKRILTIGNRLSECISPIAGSLYGELRKWADGVAALLPVES